jgi:2-haloacid dehalogenase
MRVLLFDVNETLLDLSALRPHFGSVFGDPDLAGEWFSQLLRGALVATVTGRYTPFTNIGRAALQLVAARHDREIDEEQMDRILEQMATLQPHPDVIPALERLRDAGFRLAALTNSPYETLGRQLSNAGLDNYFDAALSVDEVQLFKPHPAVYQMAADRLGAAPTNLRLIAAHNWDVTGAVRAGLQAAFVARPGMALGPLDEPIEIVGPDLTTVAARIVAVDTPD